MLKRYSQFINEADETEQPVQQQPTEQTEAPEGIKTLDNSKYPEVMEEVQKMIENTIQKSGGELNAFIESFEKNPEDVKVEGFINDADIYDFYLKYRNDIDEVLNGVKFYDQSPTEVNAYGLYEYTIKGTEKAFMEIVKMLQTNPQ
jgi:hypothetical protein